MVQKPIRKCIVMNTNPEDAPRDGTLLLMYGELDFENMTDDARTWAPKGKLYAVGRWDEVDQSFTVSTHPWYGPFFILHSWAVM